MIRLLVIVAAIWATGAAGETLKVISGDHVGFTRIVILTSPGLSVSKNDLPGDPVVTFANGPHQFDLTDAFRRIGRNRVQAISAIDGNRLRLTLSCVCSVVLDDGGPGVVILDISDPAQKQTDAMPDNASKPMLALPQLGYGLKPATDPQRDALLRLQPAMVPQGAAEEVGEMSDPETARGLQFQIARAVSQGLLDPAQSRITAPADPPVPVTTPKGSVSGARFFASRPGNQVSAETPVGQGLLDQTESALTDRQAIGCLSTERVGLADWGREGGFQQDLGHLQRDVFTETGRSDTAAARKLAQHYLFFGMGAEARMTLLAAGLTGREESHLLALAEIMDHGQDIRIGAFRHQAHCETSAALWAVLADPSPAITADAQIGAVIQAFTALPWHLKDHLGPLLVQRLRSAGNADAVDTVLRIIKRATDESSPALKLAEAEISLDDKSEAAALALLNDVAANNGQLSPEALVRMIDIEIAAGRPISTETALLAESYALEYRTTPIAQDLWRVNVLALAASQQFAKAFAMLADASDPSEAQGLWSAVLATLTREADDLTFARWAMNVPSAVRGTLSSDTGNAVTSRLLGLGFANMAEQFVVGAAEGAAGRARKILRARIALDQNRPRRAEAELTGLSGPEIDQLRAEARLATGDFAASQQLFRSLDARTNETRAAFLAGNWDRLREVGEPELAEFGALASTPPTDIPAPDDPAPLAAGNGLLDESARARAIISEMLARLELDQAASTNPGETE